MEGKISMTIPECTLQIGRITFGPQNGGDMAYKLADIKDEKQRDRVRAAMHGIKSKPISPPKRAKNNVKPGTYYNRDVVTAYFTQQGLPAPVYEHRFHPTRMWRLDIAWPDRLIAVEVEGGVWSGGRHGRGSGIVKDMEKANALTMAGWRLLRVLPNELCMQETVDMCKELMGL